MRLPVLFLPLLSRAAVLFTKIAFGGLAQDTDIVDSCVGRPRLVRESLWIKKQIPRPTTLTGTSASCRGLRPSLRTFRSASSAMAATAAMLAERRLARGFRGGARPSRGAIDEILDLLYAWGLGEVSGKTGLTSPLQIFGKGVPGESDEENVP